MEPPVTNELLYEVLKNIQARVARPFSGPSHPQGYTGLDAFTDEQAEAAH
jgi:hypothetical protein